MPWAVIPGVTTVVNILMASTMPGLIYKARKQTGHTSNSAYMRDAICQAVARDLGIPYEQLLADQPNPRKPSGLHSSTIEDVR